MMPQQVLGSQRTFRVELETDPKLDDERLASSRNWEVLIKTVGLCVADRNGPCWLGYGDTMIKVASLNRMLMLEG
ncbi:hypothetical protein scyTo_0018794 [Scyliorhinus torazame]|uniref:Uncharacterized protein n=1 Tax=Scyliorhinus torazame TaxID=75743 RepID=A0A401Q2Y4_SCYTO|nr:hypothetical protein [Scyliorhinus torazame]